MFKKALAALITISVLLPTTKVFAEEAKPKGETGSITIKYFDDSNMTVPVVDSTWMLFKVADITTYTNPDNPNVDSLRIDSLIPNFEFKGEGHENPTTPKEILEKIDYSIITESEWNVKPQLKDGTKLQTWKSTTDGSGKIVFDDLEYGVYFGMEVKASRYHVLASPFLISIPNTRLDDKTDQAISKIDLEVTPKAIVAGDLEVTKKTYGNDVDPEEWFNITITIPSGGRFYYETTRGRKGSFDEQGVIGIKAYETIHVFNVPAGAKFIVEEAEANQNGYRTWYSFKKGQSDSIDAKTSVEFFVHNERYKKDSFQFVNTGAGSNLIISAGIFLSAAIIGGVLLVKRNKNKE